MPNENNQPLRFDVEHAAAAISERLLPACFALLATREYNGPNRGKLLQDAFDLINAVDISAHQIALNTQTARDAARVDDAPKIVAP